MKGNFTMLRVLLFVSVSAFLLVGCSRGYNPAKPSADCLVELNIFTTENGVEYVRTPDACFENLPDWSYEPKYVEIDGLRQAYVDVGPADADPILLLHGQPSWSYLYRYMIPVLTEAGHRVIAMDHLGMGRSDKPIDVEYHSFENHVHRLDQFIEELELENITLFAQDWGSVIGLYLAANDRDRFDRIVVGNGGLPIVEKVSEMPDDLEGSIAGFNRTLNMMPAKQPAFYDKDGNSRLPVADVDAEVDFAQWVAYAMHYEDFRASKMLEALTFDPLTSEEEAAYDAPFPSRTAMAGPRSFPSLLNELVGITEPAIEALATYEGPFLTIFGGNEPGLGGENDPQYQMINSVKGAEGQPHHRFPDASHFLQDDKGAEVAGMVNRFIAENPR
jgi:haloalkane dehalogenase